MICFGSKYIQLITPGDYKTSKFILFNLIYRNQYPWRACCRSLKIISHVLKSTTCQTSHDCLTNKTRDDGRDLLESPQKFHSVPVSSVAFCFFASHAIDRKLRLSRARSRLTSWRYGDRFTRLRYCSTHILEENFLFLLWYGKG